MLQIVGFVIERHLEKGELGFDLREGGMIRSIIVPLLICHSARIKYANADSLSSEIELVVFMKSLGRENFLILSPSSFPRHLLLHKVSLISTVPQIRLEPKRERKYYFL